MLRNTTSSWGWLARALHWIGALLILVLLAHGWWMTHVAPRGPGRLVQYGVHASIGYDFLVLLVVRVLWRWMNPVPAMPPASARWERLSAHAAHFGLYLLMFATTIVGWALAGTMRVPMDKDVFGLTIPGIFGDKTLHRTLEDTHKYLAYVLAALVVLHVAAAIWHHVARKDDVLRRMTTG